MAYSRIKYISTGGTSVFTVPFPYMDKSHVEVLLDGVPTPAFTWLNAFAVQLDSVPPANVVVTILRSTTRDERMVDFADGSVLTERDLDTANLQMFFMAQESFDAGAESIQEGPDGTYHALDKRISGLGDALNPGDAVNVRTLQYQYPDVVLVGEHLPDIRAIATDLTSAGLLEFDFGSVLEAPNPSPVGAISAIRSCAENMEAIQDAAAVLPAIQEAVADMEAVQLAATTAEAVATTKAAEAAASAALAASYVGAPTAGSVTGASLAASIDLGVLT
jgi:hypothetical protein